MHMMRTLVGSLLILIFLSPFFACRDLSSVPTNPRTGDLTGSSTTSVRDSGLVVVRLASFTEDLVELSWCDTDSMRISYYVERKDAETSQYVVLAELSPWMKVYSDGGIKQVLHPYYYRISAVNGSSEKVYSNTIQLYLNPRRPLSVRPIHVSSSSVMLQWNFTGNISEGFLVQRSLDGNNYENIGSTPKGQLEYIDDDLDTTNKYFYRAFTLTKYDIGPSSLPIKVGYCFNPMYQEEIWMQVLF